ncbi:MAG: hypothetical protein P8X58_08525 [Syntrophobacterales bacterium]
MRAKAAESSSLFRNSLLPGRLALGLCIWFFLWAVPGLAQQSPRVQTLTGYLDAGEREIYDLPNLKKDDTLYVYMARVSGNLDPLCAVADTKLDLKSFEARLEAILRKPPKNHFQAFRHLLDSSFLVWDDDSGHGSDAALKLTIPADGDYQLIVTGVHQHLGGQGLGLTFGKYRLLIGINAPQVLSGQAAPTGQAMAKLVQPPEFRLRIQEVQGALTPQHNSTYYRLREIDPGTILHVRVEATSGNLKPALVLNNYGGKIIRADNLQGLQDVAQLQYAFKEESRNYTVHISGTSASDRQTSGSYRLLLGINAPEVLQGKGKPVGRPLILEPIQVRVGIYVDQISAVNQKDENFGVVGDLVLEWDDPAYAFSPDSCQCSYKAFDPSQFEKFIVQKGLRWPRFVFFNQQGKRWTQGETFWVYASGKVQYYERFSATLQAPDFNFKKFPLDTQKFFIHLESVDPEEDFVFSFLPEYTGLGKKLGEEEWYFTQHTTKVSSRPLPDGLLYSRYSYELKAQRHLSYYIFRIFIPLLLIISVSWVAFFLKDYSKRVDITGANLLVFIAFNFTIGSDLPRLGYLTFLDTMLLVAFAVTALTVVFNVALKRLDTKGKTRLTHRIDIYLLWGYPLFY